MSRMNDLISKSELYEKVCTWEAQALHMCEVTMNDEDITEWRRWSAILGERSAFKFDVADAPTIDAVEVVRCRDCKYGAQDDFGGWFCVGLYCTVGDKDGSGFCADGERREDADKE